MKKLIILLLAITLILGVFASCSKRYINIDYELSGSPSEDITSANEETSKETTKETEKEITSIISEETAPDITADITSNTEKAETTLSLEDILSPEIHPEYNPDYNPEAGKYTINKVGDDWYLVFESKKPEAMFSDAIIGPYSYNSMSELKGALDALTAGNRDTIKSLWKKSEYGVKVINFDELYSPILPSGISFSEKPYIFWEEDRYWFYLDWIEGNAERFDGVVEMITYGDYAELKDEEMFKSAELISKNNKSVKIAKSLYSSSENPYIYYALISTPDTYAHITLRSSRPLDSEITNIFLSFDFEEYKE